MSDVRLRYEVLRAADALADAAEALRHGSSSNRRANLTVALDAYRAARDAAVELCSPADMWFVFNEVTDECVAGPFDSYEDADDYCDGFDDVYAARSPITR